MSDFLNAIFGDDILLSFGILSGVLSACAFLPYVRDILRGHTHPQRACWLIWSVLGTICLASLIYEGATHSLWFVSVQVGGTILVFVLSIARGTGRYFNRVDYLVLAAAGFGLVMWYFADTAAYALGTSIAVSLMGGTMTILQAYKAPQKETMSTWLVCFAASCAAVLSVGSWDPLMLAYPLYLFTLYGAIVGAMVMGRARNRAVPMRRAA